MYNVIILGATSNICSIRVFDNLNNLSCKIESIICYGSKNWTTNYFLDNHYKKKVVIKNEDKLINKIKFISGKYNKEFYDNLLFNLINDKTIIYVSTPHSCYKDILTFLKFVNKNYKLILEKPLAINFNEYNDIKNLFSNKVFMIDHFLYKRDIINIINNYKNNEFRSVKLQFNYKDDVEDRLGYFDNVGFFIDMFQSHFLSIIYLLIGDKIKNFENVDIIRNLRKQYKSYGGKNNVDTYFYLEFKYENTIYIFEAGKAMTNESKNVYIDGKKFQIKNYQNEYEIYFDDIFNDRIDNSLIYYNEYFWKITDMINNDFKENCKLEYYEKNNL